MFWDWMTRRYETKVIQKDKSWVMKVCAWFLNAFHLMDKDRFLNQYVTTLNKRIYCPFKPGIDTSFSLAGQIYGCVHEHRHVTQWNFWFPFLYLFSQKKRLAFEVQGFICTLEIYYWIFRRTLSVNTIIKRLREDYHCTNKKQLAKAKRRLEGANIMLEQGIFINNISREAIQWLEKHTS